MNEKYDLQDYKNTPWWVRNSCAHIGDDDDLDILVHDPCSNVRRVVAKRGREKDLDILVHDKVWTVRATVAKHGRPQDLDILVHDFDWHVRNMVAKHGRPQDLDILENDNDFGVLKTVNEYRNNIKNINNKQKVFITYENSRYCGVTGVYTNKKLAEREAKIRGDLSIIDEFDLITEKEG